MTNYSQKANPNATNSELDAKVIIKNKQVILPGEQQEIVDDYYHWLNTYYPDKRKQNVIEGE
tara:strand:- start:1043 stop:1228 length:186 start_codon:yes stop_codon:yes gene_type:complete